MRKQITKTYEAREIYSPFGTIEYLDVGEGIPVLVSHGTMGGWDHGYMMADRLLGLGYRLIVPSRFGYLKSSIPSEPGFETQADCFGYLLDKLGIQKLAVLGLSAGGVPAMSFALKYAERVTRLILVSTALQAESAPEIKQALPVSAKVYQWFLKSDFRFRLILRISPSKIQNLLGVTKHNVAVVGPEEYDFVKLFTKAFLPVSSRFAGWLNDSKNLNLPSVFPLERINAPTLVISAQDDILAPHSWSRLVSDKIPGAKLIVHTTGGHLLLGHTKSHRQKLRNFLETSRMDTMLANSKTNSYYEMFSTRGLR
jgi:2-hydroxy-6-oxonona-2,4-dienedioate hydrolase